MRLPRLLRVAIAPLILSGCTAHPISIDTEPASGHIVARPGKPGFIVGAPHATSDPLTGEIAEEIARRTGFGLVVATGFTLETVQDGRSEYERRVRELGGERLRFYVEIHGNSRDETRGRIEIATV